MAVIMLGGHQARGMVMVITIMVTLFAKAFLKIS
jgi:hypothetical protein